MSKNTDGRRPCQHPTSNFPLTSDDYVRPEHWRDTLDCDVMDKRWADWTAPLRASDSIFHDIPNGWEREYCEALDWLRWDYLRHARRRDDLAKPDTRYLVALPYRDRMHVIEQANTLRSRWASWRGQPWHIVCDARESAYVCHQIDFYRRRAGKAVTYEPSKRRRPGEAFTAILRPALNTLRLSTMRLRRAG